MTLVNFADLDFDQVKTSITNYLRANSDFTDYDFEGSNLSTIIDVLAYNTYITSYNANMVANEVFIDSATLRENVISLARNIGYVPRSRKAARSTISFFVDTSDFNIKPRTLTLKAGVVGITRAFGRESYSFSVPEDITVTVNNDIAEFNNIVVYEGTLVSQNFTIDATIPNQRFLLDNVGIDSSLLTVNVATNENSSVSRNYTLANSLFDINGESAVYFLQEIADEKYEIIFGDGIFGKKLQEPNYITVKYMVCNGANANNLSSFTFSGNIVDEGSRVVENGISLITVNDASHSGGSIESVESVKKYATRIYASRERAVTAADYEALIPTIYPQTESVSAYGGEELSPPQFGRVYISIKPYNDRYLSNQIKDNIERDLKKYSVAGIVPEVVDLKYLYVETDSNVYYNSNLTASSDALKTSVISNLTSYANSTELNKFGARFKYSKFLNVVDNTSNAVTSNITTIQIRRDLRAVLNAFAEYEICFGNRFFIKNHGHSPVNGGAVVGYNIKSSGFTVDGIGSTVYLADTPSAGLEKGTINLIRLESPSEPIVVKRNVGTIDYVKGEIKLKPINITSTVITRGIPLIEISAIPLSNDIIGLQDLYLQLDTNNVSVSMVADQISSGADVSGSNYVSSSSYSNGNLVRGSVVTSRTTSGATTSTSASTSAVSGSTSTMTPSTTYSSPTTTTSSSSSSY